MISRTSNHRRKRPHKLLDRHLVKEQSRNGPQLGGGHFSFPPQNVNSFVNIPQSSLRRIEPASAEERDCMPLPLNVSSNALNLFNHPAQTRRPYTNDDQKRRQSPRHRIMNHSANATPLGFILLIKNPCPIWAGVWNRCLAVSYFHMGRPHTIIGAECFHFRVRDGIGWFPLAMAARQNWCVSRQKPA